jgi:hypothetical protein
MRWLGCWITGYLAIAGLVVLAMLAARSRALERLSTPESIAQWKAWQEDVRRQQAHPAPVQRQVPNSSEPPALVLMRDYFAVSLVGALVFSTALYWITAWFVSGILTVKKASR